MVTLMHCCSFGSGKILECSLAKPQADQKSSGGSSSQKGATLPTYPPRIGYGMMGTPYGALGAGFGAGYGGPGVAQVRIFFFMFLMVNVRGF